MVATFEVPMAQRLKRGLVAYWPTASAGAVDLKSALYAGQGPQDLTNNATVTRAAGPSANLPDASAYASASSQYLSRADSLGVSLGGTSSFSGCGWYWGTEAGGANTYTLAAQYETTGNQRAWWVRQTATAFSFLTSVDGTNAVTVTDATTTVIAQTWYFVYWYFDRDAGKVGLRVNLAAPTEQAQTGVMDSTGAFTLGARGSGADFLNGRLAHVGLWKRVLTAPEHFWLYNNGQGRDLTRGC